MPASPSLTSNLAKRIVVGVGDLAVSNETDAILSTYALGSCVGIVFYDHTANAAGLLHFMLPESQLTPEKAATQPAIFADTGIPALKKALEEFEIDAKRLKILMMGGASVLGQNDIFSIGEQNITAAQSALQQLGLTADAQEIRGQSNRTLHFSLQTGIASIKEGSDTREIPLR